MAYKKTVKLKFESKKDFDDINNHLEKAKIDLSSFVTFCVSRVWSEILKEHQRQQQAYLDAQKEKDEAASDEPELVEKSAQVGQGSDSVEPEEKQEASSKEG